MLNGINFITKKNNWFVYSIYMSFCLSVYSQESPSILFTHKGKCPISCFLPNCFLHADSALRSLLDPNHLFLWTEGIFLNFSPNPLLHGLMHLNHSSNQI